MAKIIACERINVVSGDPADSLAVSLVGTAGSGGIASGYYGVDAYFWIAVDENLQAYIAYGGGTVVANHKRGDPDLRRQWKLKFAYNPSSFSIYDGPSGVSIPSSAQWIYPTLLPSYVENVDYGQQEYTLPNRNGVAVGSDTSALPEGYGPISLQRDEENRRLYTYMSGLVEYASRPDDDVSMPSQLVEITAGAIVDPFFDYYPCAIRKGASWPACNRDGGFVRIRKGSWRDAKNSYGSGASTVFIKKGGSWVKSREGVS